MYRELQISFLENSNVRYKFFRTGFPNQISMYSIDYPSNKVILHNGQNLHTEDFRQTHKNNNQLVLEWDKVPANNLTKDRRIIDYEKIGLLEVISQEPLLLKYKEQIEIKGSNNNTFHLYLHKRNTRVSAIKSRSRATFFAKSRGYIHCHHAFLHSGTYNCWEENFETGASISMQPTQLADAIFHASGTLEIDWLLEIDHEKPE